jgi:hypothetical protein
VRDCFFIGRERPELVPERGRFASRRRGIRDGRDPDRLRSFADRFFPARSILANGIPYSMVSTHIQGCQVGDPSEYFGICF